MPRENEPSREINVKANPPVATLKRVMSRRHRVIGFSLQLSLHFSLLCSLLRLSLLPLPPLSLFSPAPARVVFGAMHAEDPGELASLVRIFQTPRCFPHGDAKAEDPRWRDERRAVKKRSVALWSWMGW